MLEINLLPVREARRKADVRQQLMQLVFAVMVTSAGVAFAHSQVQDDISNAQGRVKQMKKDIEKFEPQLEQVAAFKKQKSELEKKIDIIEGLDKARTGPVKMLSELAQRTPERLWLTSLRTKGSSIAIEGQSLDNELVALFLSDLGASQYFQSVDLNETEIEEGKSGGLKLVKFSITASLKSDRPPASKKGKKGKKGKKRKGKKKKKGHA